MTRSGLLKLASSLTLFRAAAQRLTAEDPTVNSLVQRCDSILVQAIAEGYRPCFKTLALVTD